MRPSHTYDRTLVPFDGGWTVSNGCGTARPSSSTATAPRCGRSPTRATSPWRFVGLLGHPRAIGDSFHITSDEALTWNQISALLAAAAGVEPELVHVPSEPFAA